MRQYMLVVLCSLSFSIHAQDTLLFDVAFIPVKSIKDAAYMKVIKCVPDNPIKCSETMFLLENNRVIFNRRYSDYPNKICQGRCSQWNTEGALISEKIYENGLKQGPDKSFYPSGQLRRLINWSHDTLVNATLYYEDGSVKPIRFKEDVESLDIQVEPSFPGGLKEMYKFLAQTVSYPEDMKEEGISGTVELSFIISKDGSVTDVEVLKSPAVSASNELIRVFKKMPRWRPAIVNEHPVRVRYTMPFKFALN